MLVAVEPFQVGILRALFQAVGQRHRILPSILAGITPARAWVDDADHPTSAAVQYHYKLYLLGEAGNEMFNASLAEMLAGQIFPRMRAQGSDAVLIFPEHAGWEQVYPALLDGQFQRVYPNAERQYYCFEDGKDSLFPGWRALIPDGAVLRPVDAVLLNDLNWEGIDALREETCSERVSVEDFLAHSFGVCLTQDRRLLSWCLSEYNSAGGCEVGIATVDDRQRQGLGTATGCAFVEEALLRGCREVGWHCWKRNLPSAALAQKIGYTLHAEERVALCLFATGD